MDQTPLSPEYGDFLLRCAKHFKANSIGDQLIKVGEEYGEACEGYSLFYGTNPYKGNDGTLGNYVSELADVAATALTAIAHAGFDPSQYLEAQMNKTLERFPDL